MLSGAHAISSWATGPCREPSCVALSLDCTAVKPHLPPAARRAATLQHGLDAEPVVPLDQDERQVGDHAVADEQPRCERRGDRKSKRLNSSHANSSYAAFFF